ncbi:MAG: MATE family efflux transporter [Oscillospiraceae bacterium]|nr:MATE family efflux transporter [Oscillospiraceae bacterium]
MAEGKIHFDKGFLSKLVVPLIIEQVLAVTVGMAAMIMVGGAGAGDEAVSGVSLVNTISNLLIYVFSAMATGGAVVASQCLGKKDFKIAVTVSNQILLLCFAIAAVVMAVSLVGNRAVLSLIYGAVEPGVMENAVTYFYITAFSFPFLSVYYGSTALFRSMGNSKISVYTSVIMNIINIGGNAVLVYGFNMGVAGVGIATLASRVVSCVVALVILRKPKYVLHIDRNIFRGFDLPIIKKVLKIGLPSGIENGMFQIGKLFTQSLITSFGTASIAANAVASTIELLATIPASAVGLALTTVVGQCVGADDYVSARSYTKNLLKKAYIILIALNVLIIAVAPTIAGWYNLTFEGDRLARQLIVYHSVCCMVLWPLAYSLASTLRAAGDVKFTLISSTASMWVFRILLSYLIGGYMHVGVLGVWIAMTIDWAVRALLNVVRFHGRKWQHEAIV